MYSTYSQKAMEIYRNSWWRHFHLNMMLLSGQERHECVWSLQLSLAVINGEWPLSDKSSLLCARLWRRESGMTPKASQWMPPPNKDKKWPPLLSYSSILVARLTSTLKSASSFIYLSRGQFACDPVAIPSASLKGRTCVYCIFRRLLEKKRGWTWVPVSCGVTFNCVGLCVFRRWQSPALFLREMQKAQRPCKGIDITMIKL